MTEVPSAAPHETREAPCPRCWGTLVGDADGRTCRVCRKRADVHLFEPVASDSEIPSGAGRCSAHPNKDAVASCTRCGAFVCDVCVTRTGEIALCPACFDTLHGRGDLETTRARRMRWDFATFSLGLLSAIPWCGAVAGAAALALGVFTLTRRRTQPWLSAGRTVAGMLLALFFTVLYVGVLAWSMTRR